MGLFKPNVEKLTKRRNVKGLVKALQYKKDWNVCADAAVALGDIGDARALEPLVATLKKHHNFYVRMVSATALGMIGDEGTIEPLSRALSDYSGDVREAAAQALAAVLKDKKIDVSQFVKRLIEAPQNPDANMRKITARLIGLSGDARAVPLLIEALKDPEMKVRETAAEALGKIGDARAAAPLIEALQNPATEVRAAAAEALVGIGGPAIGLLEKALQNGGGTLGTVADILNKLGWKPQMKEQEAYVYAAKADWKKCLEIGAPAVKPIVAMLQDADWKIRLSAVQTLGATGDARAVKPLCAALQDARFDIRLASAQALKTIGDSQAVPPLLEAIKRAGDRRNWQESVQIEEVLNSTEWKPETEELKAYRFMMKKDWKQCAKIGRPAVPLLISVVQSAGKDPHLAAAETLGEIGDVRAVKALTPLLKDKSLHARKTAALALLSIAEKNPGVRVINSAVAKEIRSAHQDSIYSWSDDCSTGSQHTDTGIGLDVKL